MLCACFGVTDHHLIADGFHGQCEVFGPPGNCGACPVRVRFEGLLALVVLGEATARRAPGAPVALVEACEPL